MARGVAPDVRDGMTPVARRALRELAELRVRTPAHVTSARVVDAVLNRGRVDGGRRAIYHELVRMASDWEVRHPLVDAQGFLGSLDGEGAASADYTKVRLGAVGDELLRDLGDDAAPPAPAPAAAAAAHGGDGTSRVLPARFPNLLVNGSFSAATEAASSVPPHNLREVVDAALAYVDDPEIDTGGLLRHIPGPDFPTGAAVLTDAIEDAYATGRGSLVVRATAQVDGGAGSRAIVVTELPFMVSKGGRGGVVADIRRAVRAKKVRGVHDVDDQSSASHGLRIVVELVPGTDPDVVLAGLYEHTQLQRRFELNLVAVVDGQARRLGLRDVIGHYVEHRRHVVARRTGLRSEQRVLDVLRDDLLDIAERHGDARRSEILQAGPTPRGTS
jgi:DNA gyrase subunit A